MIIIKKGKKTNKQKRERGREMTQAINSLAPFLYLESCTVGTNKPLSTLYKSLLNDVQSVEEEG